MTDSANARPHAVRAVAWGALVHAQVVPASTGAVIACFEHSLYLKLGTALYLCVGDERIGHGPLNVCVSTRDWRKLARCSPGAPVRVTAGALKLDDCAVLALDAPILWRPRSIGTGCRVISNFPAALECALVRAPIDGLFRVALAPALASQSVPLVRIASGALDALREWLHRLDDAYREVPTPPERIADLIGLGPGLTPSGDDLLAGVLVMLSALARERQRAALWQFIAPKLIAGTNEISRAHLVAAFQGQGHEAVHDVMQALFAHPDHLPAALDRIDALGHTSGWDGLAGVLLVAAGNGHSYPATTVASSAACAFDGATITP